MLVIYGTFSRSRLPRTDIVSDDDLQDGAIRAVDLTKLVDQNRIEELGRAVWEYELELFYRIV